MTNRHCPIRVSVFNELQRIADADGGILHAAVVLDEARDPKSALHRFFVWDAEAEHLRQHRLSHLARVFGIKMANPEEDLA
jgi:hypothetical protein